MALRGLHAELLLEMIGFVAERLMALEVGGLTGAAYGERSEGRINRRNDYHERDWQTRAGTVELRRHHPRRLCSPPRTGAYRSSGATRRDRIPNTGSDCRCHEGEEIVLISGLPPNQSPPSDLSGKRVLVTGAGGFIGSHLAERLVRDGAEVHAMIHYNALSGWGNLDLAAPEVKPDLRVTLGNIEDSDYVARACKGMDVVFHLAALIAIPYSYIAPRSYVRTNVEGTLNVLEAARQLGVGRVIHTSTSEVYGTALREPIDEDHPLQGQSPYSASKIGADKLAESYWRSFETEVVTLRPFNTFGPRQSARAFIPTIISQAFAQDTISLGSLDPLRDMTFVSDTVAGYIAAATTPGIAGETINLGTGLTFSIGDFAQRILALMGMDKPIVQEASRMRPVQSEVGKLVSDNGKARRLLGWAPEVALDDGLRATIDFVGAHQHLYRTRSYTV